MKQNKKLSGKLLLFLLILNLPLNFSARYYVARKLIEVIAGYKIAEELEIK